MNIINCQRELFDIPDDVAYFNCGYNSPLLNSSTAALIKGVHKKKHPWTRKPDDFFDGAEELRELAAKALGGTSDCYAIVPSASYGMSTVARILEDYVSKKDEILVIDEAFPSNYLPWHRLANKTNSQLVTVPTPSDKDWTSAILGYISEKTKVVAIPHCHWTNGARIDIEKISNSVRSIGAILAMDITQSLGAMPLDFKKVNPDFCVASGYKWLLAPYGLSYFYVAERWHNSLPLEDTWLGRKGAENFENLVQYSHVYQKGARRFDMGEKCIPTLIPGGIAALKQITNWGVENIAHTLKMTNIKITEILKNTILEPLPEKFRSPHMIGFSSRGNLPKNLLEKLAENKIFLSQRGASLRFAPHLHINENDLDRFESVIQKFLLT